MWLSDADCTQIRDLEEPMSRKLQDALKRPNIAAFVRDRVISHFEEKGEITDDFLDSLAAELDAMKEWKNPHLEAIDGEVYRAVLGGAAAILWALMRSGFQLRATPARKSPSPKAGR
jgi:hypothetical protein